MDSMYQLLKAAKSGNNQAVVTIIKKFKPLLISKATKYGYYDEDCYQECVAALIESIHKIKFIG